MGCGCGKGKAGSGLMTRASYAAPEWDPVARQGNRSMMHPTGAYGDAAYEASGFADANEVTALAPPDEYETVVDFGAGDGRVAIPLRALYRRVIAVDAAPAMLGRIRRRDRDIELARSDGTDLVARLGALHVDHVDAVVMYGVLAGMPYKGGCAVLKGIGAALRPGGIVLAQVPLYGVHRDPDDWSDTGTWTLDQLTYAARSAGLSVTSAAANTGRWDPAHPGPFHAAIHVLHRD